MASRFVRPELRTIPISNGDSLTVRKRLTAGEQRAMFARMMATSDGDTVNRMSVGISTISAYLVDWTLRDDSGNLVPIADKSIADIEATVDALDIDSFREIREAIEKHVDEMQAEREREKQSPFGESESSPTSPSRNSSAGLMPTSVN